jgi:hypothetical protein
LGFSASLGASASIGLALGGESAADFAVRTCVDASAWRSLTLGGESSLSFSAGAEIAFNADATASLGLGFTAGVTAGVSASLEPSLGLTARGFSGAVATFGGSGSAVASGMALTSAGGVPAYLDRLPDVWARDRDRRRRRDAEVASFLRCYLAIGEGLLGDL